MQQEMKNMSLKDSWKQVGRDFKDMGNSDLKNLGKGIGKTAVDFGKTMIKTVKYSADRADEWANGKNEKQEEEEK